MKASGNRSAGDREEIIARSQANKRAKAEKQAAAQPA